MKSLLLFLAGLLVGANVVYFLLAPRCVAPSADNRAAAGTRATGDARRRGPTPATAPASHPSQATPAAPTTLPAARHRAAQSPPAGALLLPVAGIQADAADRHVQPDARRNAPP